MKPKIVLLEDYGVEVTLEGHDPVVLYGQPGMTHEEMVERVVEMKNPDEQYVVRKPGDIVIEVPKFDHKMKIETPATKKDD